jgi:hypothetical protein
MDNAELSNLRALEELGQEAAGKAAADLAQLAALLVDRG